MSLITSNVEPPPAPEDPVPDSDHRLVARIRAGEVAAFEELYQRYWANLYAFCFRYVRSADEAADVVQEVFFRIWRGRESWRVLGKLENYLHFAVRNGAFDRLEKTATAQRWRERRRADIAADSQSAAAPPTDEALQTAELHATIERALADLPERRRAVCMLRWLDGLTYAEIAARLGIAEKTVENHLASGVREVRARMRDLMR